MGSTGRGICRVRHRTPVTPANCPAAAAAAESAVDMRGEWENGKLGNWEMGNGTAIAVFGPRIEACLSLLLPLGAY